MSRENPLFEQLWEPPAGAGCAGIGGWRGTKPEKLKTGAVPGGFYNLAVDLRACPMRYQRLDLNLLPALRALLTEKNVTRAGESIHMTQSAMSGVLARLRDYFDDPLVVQVGRRMELTPLAESLVDKVNDLLLRVDAALASRPAFEPALSRRHFTVIASDYVSTVLLVDVLREVSRVAPGVTIELLHPHANGAAALEAGEVDFIINPVQFA